MRKYYYKEERIFLTESKEESCCCDCFFGEYDCNIEFVKVEQPGKIFKLSAATICFSRRCGYFTKP